LHQIYRSLDILAQKKEEIEKYMYNKRLKKEDAKGTWNRRAKKVRIIEVNEEESVEKRYE